MATSTEHQTAPGKSCWFSAFGFLCCAFWIFCVWRDFVSPGPRGYGMNIYILSGFFAPLWILTWLVRLGVHFYRSMADQSRRHYRWTYWAMEPLCFLLVLNLGVFGFLKHWSNLSPW